MYGIEAEHSGIYMGSARSLLEDGYSDKGWQYHYDGSVRERGGEALELVSPILRHDTESTRDTRTLLNRVKNAGGTVDVTCGLHVHHDARQLLPHDVLDVVTTYAYFQPAIDRILPESRRTDNDPQYCHPVELSDLRATQDLADSSTSQDEFALACQWWDRYRTVNIAALRKHGTLEFRQHSGTLNSRKVLHWVQLTKAIMRSTGPKSITESDKPEPGSVAGMVDWLGLPKVTRDFYLGREAELNNGGDSEDQEQVEYPYWCNECESNDNGCSDRYGCEVEGYDDNGNNPDDPF